MIPLIPLTWGDVGAGALRAALGLALWGLGAAAYAGWKRDARALASARAVAIGAFGLVLVADLSMVGALLTHDFSLVYVAENNARETPAPSISGTSPRCTRQPTSSALVTNASTRASELIDRDTAAGPAAD